MRFTKGTYRKARKIQLVLLADLTHDPDTSKWDLDGYEDVLELAKKIVARGRREKGLWL